MSRVRQMWPVLVAVCLAVGTSCSTDGDAEVREDLSEQEIVDGFCAPLTVESREDPAGDLARRLIGASSGTEDSGIELIDLVLVEGAPEDVAAPSEVLATAIRTAVEDGDSIALDTPDTQAAMTEINAWVAANCTELPAESQP